MEDLPHIWRHISPFEVYGGKDTLFDAFSTYLEANSFHEEMPCRIVDMIKPSKERHLLMKMASHIMDPFYALKGKRSKMSHIGGKPKHDMWQEKRTKEEHPCLDVACNNGSNCMVKGRPLIRSITLNG